MANICSNAITLHGHPIAVERALALACGGNRCDYELDEQLVFLRSDWLALSCEEIVPEPLPIGVALHDVPAIRQYVDERWYRWQVEHWGCKWGADSPDYVTPPNGHTNGIRFDSPNCAPTEVLRALSGKVPTVVMECFAEEGGNGILYKSVYARGVEVLHVDQEFPEDTEAEPDYREFAIDRVADSVATAIAQSEERIPPLFTALQSGDTAKAKALARSEGAWRQSCHGWSSLEYAAWKGAHEVLAELARRADAFDGANLLAMAHNGYRACIQAGNKPSVPRRTRTFAVIVGAMAAHDQRLSPEFFAANVDLLSVEVDASVARCLFERLQPVDAHPYRDFTVTTAILASGEYDLLVAAAGAGVDVNARDPEGHTALMLESRNGLGLISLYKERRSPVECCGAAGIDFDLADANGLSAADHLLRSYHYEVLDALLRGGMRASFKLPIPDSEGSVESVEEFIARNGMPEPFWRTLKSILIGDALNDMRSPAGMKRKAAGL
jgi:hypothetical protein